MTGLSKMPKLTEASRSAVFKALDALAEDIVYSMAMGQWSTARAMFNQIPPKRIPYVTWKLCMLVDPESNDAVERLVILTVD